MTPDFDPTVLDKKPKPDGGPAFPFSFTDRSKAGIVAVEVYSGMSTRDWFAGQALVVIGACGRIGDAPPVASIASMAYQLADAMLAERAK